MIIRQLITRVDLFALTFTVAWMLGVFAISPTPLHDLWRPLIVATSLALVWMLATSAISRGNHWVMISAACAWLLALTAWFVVAVIGLLIVIRIGLIDFRRRRARTPFKEPTTSWVGRMANTLGIALCLAGLIGAVNGGAISFPQGAVAQHVEAAGGPNIYLILLDGYPRADTIAEEFGFSNDGFLASLEERGFGVARDSRSNYNTTVLTLASMLHMDYHEAIESLTGEPGAPVSQVRRLTSTINNAPVLTGLRGAGYQLVSIRSWYGDAALTKDAEVHFGGQMTLFEEQVLRLGTAGKMLLTVNPDLVADQQRESVDFAFSELRTVAASDRSEPMLVLAHVFSPHPPFLFTEDGGPREAPPCYPAQCSFNITDASALGLTLPEYGAALAGQLEHLNGEILATADAIVEDDPEAVVVIFSDHGLRYAETQTDEQLRILFAARTPGHQNLFPNDASPVNVFSLLYNAYFETNLLLREYRAWSVDPGAPLEFGSANGTDRPQ